MSKPPSPPGRGLLVCIEVLGFAIVVFQFFRSHEPDSVKLAIVVAVGLALYTSLVFHLGRRYEWWRSNKSHGEELTAGGDGRGVVRPQPDRKRSAKLS